MIRFSLVTLLALSLLKCSTAFAGEKLPPPADKTVSFSKDVKVILAHHCFECHGGTKKKGGLNMTSREALIKGGETGAGAVVGKSAESAMIKRLVSADPDEVMPQKGEKLNAEQIGILRAWIDQGMVWDEATVDREKKISLALKRPEIKPAAGENPIDAILSEYFKKNPLPKTPAPIDDRVFARRVYYDVTGLPPTTKQLDEFLADTQPNKRELLVQRALADNAAYAAHWISFWSDLLRNGTTLAGIDGFKNVNITPWLDASLKNNKPYNQFVTELLNPTPETDAFIKGVRMRGVVPASQTSEMQAAQNVSQVFLGLNIKCASCHDSFVSRWTLDDAYGLASVFSDAPVEMVRCEVPTGKKAATRFLYSELGEIDAKAPKPERLKQLAALMTKPENGQFARTIVNRLWGRFFGRAIVEPVDEMENPAWNSELLDYLAADLVDNGYDIKKTIARILTSKAYQMPSVDRQSGKAATSSKAYVFNGPMVRRLTAEQHVDTLYVLLGIESRVHKEKTNTLLEALGRPDRNNVATTRDSEATTLQALELMNGPELSKLLYQDSKKRMQAVVTELKASKSEWLKRVYAQSLCRAPNAAELSLAEAMPGPLTADMAADIAWAVTMLPEFQLIR